MHGENAEKRIDTQWWGKRPLSNYTISYRNGRNKFFKRLLHKIERRIAKNEIQDRVNDAGWSYPHWTRIIE